MNMIPDAQWSRLLPALRSACPRLTEQDLTECEQRVDLLTAKIQNRHWIEKHAARRLAMKLLGEAAALPGGAP